MNSLLELLIDRQNKSYTNFFKIIVTMVIRQGDPSLMSIMKRKKKVAPSVSKYVTY